MSRKLRSTKSTTQARDKQVAKIFEKLEGNIEKFKTTIQNKDKKLVDLGKISKGTKGKYRKVTKENK